MAIMYPKSISEYMPTDSERIVYHELKNQLPDNYEVFYSVNWTSFENGKLEKSEADFIVTCPEFGYLCLEVKGGTGIRVFNNKWRVFDNTHGERELTISPYDQAEKSMYYFMKSYSNKYNMKYQGIYGAGVVFPFYSLGEDINLDKRSRICTLDSNDLNNIHENIKKMFRAWSGDSFGRRVYAESQHRALMELIRERIAISAAAGALVKFKEQQLAVINRVQSNYIYFINNIRQFYIRGGAGTGKTWIAMKMAINEAQDGKNKVLFLCASSKLADMVRAYIGDQVEVKDTKSFFRENISDFESYIPPDYFGLLNGLKPSLDNYSAIFVDEAQDFTAEWAQVVLNLLIDKKNARLGIFYDDVQVLRDESFKNGFGIDSLPFLLRENIRNTSNIYSWTAEKTKLGKDVIANPVEGPTPITEYISEQGQLTLLLETIFRRYIKDEYLPNHSLTLLTDDISSLIKTYPDGITNWNIIHGEPTSDFEISAFSVEEFKGLESDMVVYIHNQSTSENMNYIAYTRAKYYLIELVILY